MFASNRRPEIVNYVANDDGYRADISVGQREKPIVQSVQDVSDERDVNTGIVPQSANLAEIQSTVGKITKPQQENAIDDGSTKYGYVLKFNSWDFYEKLNQLLH